MTKLTRTGPSSWSFEGELTFATVTGMLTAGPKVDPTKPAVVDLSGLTRGDSAGLSLLVEWLAAARASGGVLRYTGLPENFARLARVAGLDFLNSPLNNDHGLRRFVRLMVFLAIWYYDLAREWPGRWALPTNLRNKQ